MTDTNTFVTAGTATQPQRFVVAEAESVDAAQASGAWIATDSPREIER